VSAFALGVALGVPLGFVLAVAFSLHTLRRLRLRVGELGAALDLLKAELAKMRASE